jgi:diguanylate cyclase (GGDEF)-like protein
MAQGADTICCSDVKDDLLFSVAAKDREMSNREPNSDALLNRLRVLGELIRLSMTLGLEEMLEKIVATSTEVLGDTAFIVLESETRYQLQAAFCTDPDQLKRMLMTAVGSFPQTVVSELLRGALDKGDLVFIPNLPHVKLAPELQSFVAKHGLLSMIATPVRGKKDRILGAFISISTAPKMLMDQHTATAIELADFTAMVIENARAATTDALTVLYNRRSFDEALDREVARAQRYFTPLSLLMIDVDDFKAINDTYGHDVADQVLIHIGQAIKACVRTTDLVFRYGGDEFAVILPGTSVQGALRAATKILERVRSGDTLQLLGRSDIPTVSIGIAAYRRGISSETLVRNADQALLDAKRSGKNTIRIFKEDQ